MATATFAAGRFWGVEAAIRLIPGVVATEVGFMGGHVANPTFRQVGSGATGHAEVVRIEYDPDDLTYGELLSAFWNIHDPTQRDRQGPDVGSRYRSAVFYADDEQKRIAEKLLGELKQLGYKVVTEIAPAGKFYAAEDYHQDYMEKHPGRPTCHLRVPRFKTPAR